MSPAAENSESLGKDNRARRMYWQLPPGFSLSNSSPRLLISQEDIDGLQWCFKAFFFFYELIYTFHLFDYDNGIIAHCTEEVLLLKPSDRWICRMCLCSYIRKNSKWIIPVHFTYATVDLSEYWMNFVTLYLSLISPFTPPSSKIQSSFTTQFGWLIYAILQNCKS